VRRAYKKSEQYTAFGGAKAKEEVNRILSQSKMLPVIEKSLCEEVRKIVKKAEEEVLKKT